MEEKQGSEAKFSGQALNTATFVGGVERAAANAQEMREREERKRRAMADQPSPRLRQYRERIERISAALAVAEVTNRSLIASSVVRHAFEIAKCIVDRVDKAEPPEERP